MENEIWKTIEGYENYQISNLGNGRSLDRTDTRNRFKKGVLLKGLMGTNGYLSFNLYKNSRGNQRKLEIHKLVSMYFVEGYQDRGDKIIDHINNNPLDNRAVNLQLISRRKNCTKDKIGGTSKYIGVSWVSSRGKWRSAIRIDKKIVFLGNFNNEIDASNAYQIKLNETKRS